MDVCTPKELLQDHLGVDPSEVEIPEELKELQGSAEELSEEEKIKRRKEAEDMSTEELFRKFGLEDEL